MCSFSWKPKKLSKPISLSVLLCQRKLVFFNYLCLFLTHSILSLSFHCTQNFWGGVTCACVFQTTVHGIAKHGLSLFDQSVCRPVGLRKWKPAHRFIGAYHSCHSIYVRNTPAHLTLTIKQVNGWLSGFWGASGLCRQKHLPRRSEILLWKWPHDLTAHLEDSQPGLLNLKKK